MHWSRDGKIGRLVLDQREKLNAMDYEGAVELNRVAEMIRDDAQLRLVVITGAGRAFCTGIDLKELSADKTPRAYFEQWDRALRILERSEKIVITVMQGYALGGGLQLALASDIRIATTDCQLGLPAIQESIIPGMATYRLERYVGLGRAKQMIISGDNIDGRRALELGLVDHVVSPENCAQEVESYVDKYVATCSQGTRHSKVLLGLSNDMAHAAFYEEYLRRQHQCLDSPDHAEAKAAYRERRKPSWG